MNVLKLLAEITLGLLIVYILARLFMRGLLQELDLFLGKKFTNYINQLKQKKDENDKEKEK